MEPASEETEKENNCNEDENVEKEDEPMVDESEFQKCSRKGRRDACPDIHCQCGDSEKSDKCVFHKETVESDLKEESAEEKT